MHSIPFNYLSITATESTPARCLFCLYLHHIYIYIYIYTAHRLSPSPPPPTPSLVQAHAMRDHPHASALMPPAPPPAVGESRTAYFALLRVMRWLASSGLDPNDPRNADLLELKKYRRGMR